MPGQKSSWGCRLNLILLSSFSITTGCVGPMSPFGGLSLRRTPASFKVDAAADGGRHVRVRFTPERQVLHGPTTFSLIIEDPMGVPDDAQISITYNGVDVTSSFVSMARESSTDPFRREVRWTTRNLRLPSNEEHLIQAYYRRDTDSAAVTARYMPPICSAFETRGMLARVPQFHPPFEVIQQINQSAIERRLNPYFVAALVAQESGFNPQAVSPSRAVGLTQVTPLGDEELSKRFQHWPRYPGLKEMPFPILKLAVMGGQIHSGNEWRLDPSRSIEGGVAYLSYLTEYWSRPDKRGLIERRLGPSDTSMSQVILASYNSGAARVGDALRRSGRFYLKDSALSEANRYVNQVISYCDHFENTGASE